MSLLSWFVAKIKQFLYIATDLKDPPWFDPHAHNLLHSNSLPMSPNARMLEASSASAHQPETLAANVRPESSFLTFLLDVASKGTVRFFITVASKQQLLLKRC